MRKIAIRIDDITPEMDWTKFYRFERILNKQGIRPLIGVVPENRDAMLEGGKRRNPDFEDPAAYAAWLHKKQEAGWCIALHGCYHVYETKKSGLFPLNRFSEFAGRPYETQLELLQYGKEKLKKLGVETEIFMAPGHSFDRNTLRALKECGFRYVTDGFGDAPYQREDLTFLPISFLRGQERKKEDGVTTFVIHTWEMSESEIRWYEDLFANERERFIDYGELLTMPAEERGKAGNIKEFWMATGKRMAGKVIG